MGNGEGPVVAVAAYGADELLFGDDFEDAGEVADEPLLTGDGAGTACNLVLVVVHEDDAVGVGGNQLEIVVGDGNDGVDVEAEVARVHVGIELLNKAQVGRVGVVGEAFKVQR